MMQRRRCYGTCVEHKIAVLAKSRSVHTILCRRNSRLDGPRFGARHSQRVSGAALNLILGHPGVSGFAVRNAECPVSRCEMRSVRCEMRSVRFRGAKCEVSGERRNAKCPAKCEMRTVGFRACSVLMQNCAKLDASSLLTCYSNLNE